jgi:hypothetical protein
MINFKSLMMNAIDVEVNASKWLKPYGRQYPISFCGKHGIMQTIVLSG